MHISQLANRYIKSPHDVVSVGDVVTVWVMSVDQERKRVSLTMVKPGTERHRGPRKGGQRRGQGSRGEQREGSQGQGQGRRIAAAPPRPSGSALTSPPVGAAPIAALAEPPSRRPDRDRGGAWIAAGTRVRRQAAPAMVRARRPRHAGARPPAGPGRAPDRVAADRAADRWTRARAGRPRTRPARRPQGPRGPQALAAQPSASASLQGGPFRQRAPADVRPAQATLGGAGGEARELAAEAAAAAASVRPQGAVLPAAPRSAIQPSPGRSRLRENQIGEGITVNRFSHRDHTV